MRSTNVVLGSVLTIALVAALAGPAEARRGRGSDDGVNGHRSSGHHANDHHASDHHGCRRSTVWSAKTKSCVPEKGHRSRGAHHGPGHS